MLDGQNLPAISNVLDVPYRTLWGWINESEENRQRYDEAREVQIEMIRVKVDEVLSSPITTTFKIHLTHFCFYNPFGETGEN